MATTDLTQTKLICITIAQPKAETVCPEVTGVDGGTKNNRQGRLLKHTNEFTQ
jgi:hypothetical protein